MVFFLVLLDSSDDGSCPLNYQIFQAIALVQVGVHELFHGFAWKPVLFTLLIKLGLLLVYVIYHVAKLTKRQSSRVCLSD